MKLKELQKKMDDLRNQMVELRNKNEKSSEDLTKMKALKVDFDKVAEEYEVEKSFTEVENFLQTPAPQISKPQVIEVANTRHEEKRHGFENRAQFYTAVRNAAKGDIHENLNKFTNMQNESVGSEGGYLVPTDFREEIQEKVMSDESLLPLTDSYTTSKNKLSLPVSETAAWGATGIQAYWEGEAAKYTSSKEQFGDVDFKLKKLTAMVKVTDELLDDAPALESFIKRKAPAAMLAKINSAIISGTGVGMPTGILNSGFKYKVAKEAGQAAASLLFENISKMWSRILPEARSRMIWLYHPAIEEKLRLLKFDASAASPVPAFLPPAGLSASPYGTLMGRPAMPMMGALKQLGKEGDIIAVDLSYYISVMKTAGIEQFISTHVFFDQDLTAYKFRTRLDGQCPFKSPVQTENGAYDMSGIVTLEDR